MDKYSNITLITNYLVDFLAGFSISGQLFVSYAKESDAPLNSKIVIVPAVPCFEINAMPDVPFEEIEGTPLIYGYPKIERRDGRIIVYADIIASSFFLLSRYEETLKPACRDQHGRFTANDSIIFQLGFGERPLVDEYALLFRKWLREAGITIPAEKNGFQKIYLTHDIDEPFVYDRFSKAYKQFIKNMIACKYSEYPLRKYFNSKFDDNYSFPDIINIDAELKKKSAVIDIEVLYFLITAGSFFNKNYYNFFSWKIRKLLKYLSGSGAVFGIHASYEAGGEPCRLCNETARFRRLIAGTSLKCRYHFLRWRDPEDISYMEKAGITDDFTLSFADAAGFRTGTCHPYRFITPKTKKLTNIIIHPLEIMDCTLDRSYYMNLDYDRALDKCKSIINEVYKYNGELVLLWHNTELLGQNYHKILYKNVLLYIDEKIY